ncbi:MAG: CHASE2 domain-containing protein [Bacteroidaceae bacterium]|nr:CHASE2 domain-containing protein [Bacteroidaceae bacterium]
MLKLLKRIFGIDHLLVTLLTFLFIALILTLAVNISFFNPIERAIESFSMIDVCYQVEKNTQEPDTSHLITIVDISEVKDRDKIALMVDSIREAQPAVVAFDVIFDPLLGTEEENMQLLESLSALPVSRYAFMMKEWDQQQHTFTVPFRSFFFFDEFEQDGYVNTPESADGSTLRTFSLNRVFMGDTIESFPLKIASAYDSRLEGMRGEDRIIDFSPTYFPEVNWNEISSHADLLRDRIVIVGALHDLIDNHYTSIGRIAGVKVVAHSVQTLLENRNVRHASPWLTALITFLVVYFTQIWQHFLLVKMRRSKSTFWLFALRSESFVSMLTFLWVCLITFLNFVVFRIDNLSIDLLWMLCGVAVVSEARGLYRAFVCVMGDRKNIALFRRSIYYMPLAKPHVQ